MWTRASASRLLVTLERKADQVTFAAGKMHDQSGNHWKRLSKTPFSPQPLKDVTTELKTTYEHTQERWDVRWFSTAATHC